MLKLLQTAGLNRPHDFTKTRPRDPGPMTTTAGEEISDADFCIRFAYPEEWKRFAAEVRKRRADEPKERFYRCDNPKCGFRLATRFKRESETGSACIKCNWENFKDGGHIVEMKKGEVETWRVEQAAAREKEAERDRRAKAWHEAQEKGKAGLL